MVSSTLNGPGWKVSGDFVAPESHKIGRFCPRIGHLIKALPMLIRFVLMTIASWWRGRGLFMNMFQIMKCKPFYGVPCGGIGSGAIGRDFRGGFCKYSLLPGIVEQTVESIKANQFIVSIRSATGDECIYQKVLSCVPHQQTPLSSWEFGFPASNVTYRGLYPRSWTEYEIPELDIVLTCRQISPVIPHDYKDSCLPVCVFVWSVQNASSKDYRISLAFTFRDGTGSKLCDDKSLCRAEQFVEGIFSGVKLRHSIRELGVCYAIATVNKDGVFISKAHFDPDSSGEEIWNSLRADGHFANRKCDTQGKTSLGVAVCAQFFSKRRSSIETEFALAWDMPTVRFGGGKRQYTRRYARFFPEASKRAEHLCSHALNSRIEWEKKIDAWQTRVLDNDSLPEWYKSALFNESYFLTDGGCCWLEYDDEWRSSESQMTDETASHFKEFGRFAYLEAWEYYMFNTYDVHFYSSFAILENWPQLELSIQLDFADQVLSACDHKKLNLKEATTTEVKKRGRLPHDLGNPLDEPWLHQNAYSLNDTCNWKDLNLKFVLSCYRDYERIVKVHFCNEDAKKRILTRFYELSSGIIADGQVWDVDGDDLIENNGCPDQTYDVWSMNGSSAYCGGLWLCALECARRMACALGKEDDALKYANKLNNAKKAYERKLWNGRYFDFDERSEGHKSIMADQLCGFWFMSVTDGKVDDTLVDREKVCSSLRTIFEYNVEKFEKGELGPVNGMMPSGVVDGTSVQSEEVWGGVAYALASFQLLVDQRDSGFKTAEGWYRSCWERFGLQYQSPEAITESRYYRAIGYMRPLAVWAVQSVLDAQSEKRL
ncbi:unnamed protein product [Toxocara canis]|uniref:Non-lysosomal glucosylceramidase n=1 Tax=Toxocara canis TaxID=6265 RepID=A0A183UL49_TOXCA|nr:unnamed protein product [Toxocara canis]